MSPNAAALLDDAGFQHLPESWSVTTLGTLLAQERGISVGVMYPGNHDPAGVPLIKAADLVGNVIRPEPEFRISRAKHDEYRRTELMGGELLISLVGEVGRCAVVSPAMRGWNAARAIAVLRFVDAHDADFVRICLLSPPLQHLMQAWATTTVQATLNLKEIRQLPLPWPSRGEREAIVETLGGLDAKIGLNCRMNQTLESIARAVFESWFVDFDPVRKKMEGGEVGLPPALAALFSNRLADSRIGPIPAGWEVGAIGDVVRVVGGSTPSTKTPSYWGGAIAFATPRDMARLAAPVLRSTERRVTAEGAATISSGVLEPGAVLLSSRAPIGYLAISEIPVCVNQGFIVMLCDADLPNHYVLNWARRNMDAIVASANGTTFLEVSKRSFRPLPIVVPPKEVLAAFVALASPLNRRVVAALVENEALAEARDRLLRELLVGRLRDAGVAHSAN